MALFCKKRVKYWRMTPDRNYVFAQKTVLNSNLNVQSKHAGSLERSCNEVSRVGVLTPLAFEAKSVSVLISEEG